MQNLIKREQIATTVSTIIGATLTTGTNNYVLFGRQFRALGFKWEEIKKELEIYYIPELVASVKKGYDELDELVKRGDLYNNTAELLKACQKSNDDLILQKVSQLEDRIKKQSVLETQIGFLQNSNDFLTKENQTLNQQLSEIPHKYYLLELKPEIEKEISELMKKNKSLTSEISSLKGQNSTFEKEFKKLKEENTKVTENYNFTVNQLHGPNGTGAMIQEQARKIGELKKENAKLKQENETWGEEWAQYHKSGLHSQPDKKGVTEQQAAEIYNLLLRRTHGVLSGTSLYGICKLELKGQTPKDIIDTLISVINEVIPPTIVEKVDNGDKAKLTPKEEKTTIDQQDRANKIWQSLKEAGIRFDIRRDQPSPNVFSNSGDYGYEGPTYYITIEGTGSSWELTNKIADAINKVIPPTVIEKFVEVDKMSKAVEELRKHFEKLNYVSNLGKIGLVGSDFSQKIKLPDLMAEFSLPKTQFPYSEPKPYYGPGSVVSIPKSQDCCETPEFTPKDTDFDKEDEHDQWLPNVKEHSKERFVNLLDAMAEYVEIGKQIPKKWQQEYDDTFHNYVDM